MSETQEAPADGGASPDPTPNPAPDTSRPQQEQQQPEEGAKPEPEARDKPEREPWFVKRIAELTRADQEKARELENAQRRLRELQPEPPADPNDPARAVEARARQLVAEQQWNKDCNAMHDAGVREFPDFPDRMATLARAGGIPNAVIEAAMETGEGHKVLYALGGDPDQAMRIRDMTPARMGVALARLAAQPVQVPVSRAPAPLRTIGGGTVRDNADPEKMSMAEYTAWRNKQTAARAS